MEKIEDKEVKTKRQLLAERMAGRYPDKNFDEDEELYGQIIDDFDDFDRQSSRHKEIDDQLSERFESNPQFAGMFLDALGGKDPVVAFVERYGEDVRAYLDDPEKQEELAEANKKYLERVNKEKELNEAYEANIQESLRVADEVQAAGGYTDEQVNEAFNLILTDANNAILGIIDAATLETKIKGLSRDEDVAEAAEQAEVRGRNAKIDAKKRELGGDANMPAMLQGKGAPAERQRPPKEIEALDRVVPRNDVWAGLKREKR